MKAALVFRTAELHKVEMHRKQAANRECVNGEALPSDQYGSQAALMPQEPKGESDDYLDKN